MGMGYYTFACFQTSIFREFGIGDGALSSAVQCILPLGN